MKSSLPVLLALLTLLTLLPIPAAGEETAWSLVTLGDAVLFFARDGGSGFELWRSDGTAAGTFQLSKALGELPEPQPFAVTERLFFFVSSTPNGFSSNLWVSDGTPAGTFRLTGPDVTVDGNPRVWVAGQGLLYFIGNDWEHGIELWRTDGTPAGTRLAADIWPGPEHSYITEMTEYQGQAWFGAYDGQHGGSLWRSDGAAAGTTLAVDPFPASAANEPPELIRAVGSRITFFARDPDLGLSFSTQLWGGDGTAGGTSLISKSKDLYSSAVWGDRLYFIAGNKKGQELWVSDGTRPGTRPLTDFPEPGAFRLDSLPREGLGDGRFLFWADDGARGFEPWITDGTPQGTRLLRNLCSGECSSSSGNVSATFGGRLYFSVARGFSTASELWSTDGTRAGTRRLSGREPENCPCSLGAPFVVGDRLLFVAWDEENGEEIWSTNGKGFVRVTDFEYPYPWEQHGFQGALLGRVLLFRVEQGLQLWRTDGTPEGTFPVQP